MPHDPLASINHMISHAREARALAAGRLRSDMDADGEFAMLMTHLMEIFGEASARVPEDFREIHPEFDWQDAADLRNVLIHRFDDINYDILWEIVSDELPLLIAQLEVILEQEG